MLFERLNSKEDVWEDKNEILSQIQDIENNKKRYVRQLNNLSASGKSFINETEARMVNAEGSNKYELQQDDEYRFSFTTPSKKRDLNGKIYYAPTSRKELELSFFDVENLLYLDKKVNYKGAILSKEQKKLILSKVAEIMNHQKEN